MLHETGHLLSQQTSNAAADDSGTTSDLDVDGKRHHEDGHHDVGDRQGHDEVVGGAVKSSLYRVRVC